MLCLNLELKSKAYVLINATLNHVQLNVIIEAVTNSHLAL